MKTDSVLAPHWIIYNEKKASIWGDVYFTYEAAKEELTRQEQINGRNPDWVIEKRETWRKSDSGGF